MFPNLKLQIWKTGLRQNRVAQMVDIDETLLSKILNGFREPSAELKGKLAKLLDCDSAWLFEKQSATNEPAIRRVELAQRSDDRSLNTGAESAAE